MHDYLEKLNQNVVQLRFKQKTFIGFKSILLLFQYQRGGCWITLIKSDPMPWMNRICDDFNPGLDTQEDDNQDQSPSAPVEDVQLKDTNMPPPFNLVPIAPIPPPRSSIKKAPAPPPPPPTY